MTRDPSVERARRWYRRLWALYPAAFRERFESSALDAFEDRYREERARRGPLGTALFWMRTVANVAIHGPVERVSSVTASAWVEGTGADIRDSVRSTRRAWRQHVAAVLCIGLGIAVTGAILTLVTSTLLRPLPFPEADRLVRVWSVEESAELGGRGQLSYPDLRDLRESLTTFDEFVVSGRARVMFLGDRGARRVEGEAIGPGYLELLGIDPLIGRTFAPDDFLPSSPPTMLLAFPTWVRDYAADPSMVGRTIRTADGEFTVIGVLPEAFFGTIESDIPEIEFWIPLEHYVTDRLRALRDAEFIWAIGRLAPGATLSMAREQATALGERLLAEGVLEGPNGYWAEPFGENWRSDLRWRNYLLLGAAGLLLLISAINVAGLLVARAIATKRGLAVRAAMGASRVRLVRRTLVETLLITGAGAGLGLAVAPWLLRTFMSLAPTQLPTYVDLTPGPRSLGIALVVIVCTAVCAGIVPAILGSRVAPGTVLRAGGRSATSGTADRRAGRWLVVGEVALTMVLLSTATLLVESYRALGAVDVGYRSTDLLKVAVFVDGEDVPDDDELPAFYRALKQSLTELPGVLGVGFASPTVPPGFSREARARWSDMPEPSREHGVLTAVHPVDPDLIDVLDIELLAGRGIEGADDETSRRVAVISESLADLMGGPADAVERTVDFDGIAHDVVGVVEDVRYLGAASPRPQEIDAYVPLLQNRSRTVSMALLTTGRPEELINPVRAEIAALTPRSPLDWIASMEDDLTRGFEGPRFYAVLLLAFAGSALLLTAAGLFAILAHKVAGERGELAIRRAFGASRGTLLLGVVRDGAWLCGWGVALGSAGSLVAGWILARRLLGIDPVEPVGALAAAALILATGVLASLIPAVRATRASPMEAMRDS